MRHRKSGRKLGRNQSHRKAMFRTMASSLILHGRIETTVQKAKEIRPIVEKLITLGREDNINTRRRAASYLRGKEPVQHLFEEVSPRYLDRPGGYTRILRVGTRVGDAASMAIVELVDRA